MSSVDFVAWQFLGSCEGSTVGGYAYALNARPCMCWSKLLWLGFDFSLLFLRSDIRHVMARCSCLTTEG